ncbi:MAG: response regulator transcription factor [Flavobacteriales bacterium]|jgi:DNA-binding NarL/FixJ family response regulator|nr:response regulator transcription factor [Flavobacteriales bacterium]
MMLNILVVDDHEDIRIGVEYRLKSALEESFNYFAAKCKRSMISKLHQVNFDLVICDLQLSQGEFIDHMGFDLATKIKKIHPNCKVIAYSSFIGKNIIKKCIKSGFDLYLPKSVGIDEFSEALETVLKKNIEKKDFFRFLNDISLSEVDSQFGNSIVLLDLLSSREIQLLDIMSGLESLDTVILADKMSISIDTINTHIRNIRKKLKLNNRQELFYFAKNINL